MSGERVTFSGDQLDALRYMVGSWIAEGFTTPPYADEEYDIFEALGLDSAPSPGVSYDTRRPRKPAPPSTQEGSP